MSDPLTSLRTLESVPFILIIRKPMVEYIIYTQAEQKCAYCDKAIALLTEKNIPHTVRALKKEHLLQVAARAGMSTVPIIYHEDDLVGGFGDLEEKLN